MKKATEIDGRIHNTVYVVSFINEYTNINFILAHNALKINDLR